LKTHKLYLYLCMFVLFFCIALYSKTLIGVGEVNATTQTAEQIIQTSSMVQKPQKMPKSSQINYTDNLSDKTEKSTLSEHDLLFHIKDKNNLQGITFFNKNLYCGFDIRGGNGKIVKYNMVGEKVSETKPMKIGHCADISYRISTNKIYVANGGGHNLTQVYVVDYDKSEIQKTLNYSGLGTSALLAIDNVHDYLILHTVLNLGDGGNPTFTIINLANMKVINSFNVTRIGVPQGLETDGKYIYFYTNNKITILNYNGAVIATYPVNKRGESEGISMVSDHGIPYLVVGYNSPNRIYTILTKEIQNSQKIKKVKKI